MLTPSFVYNARVVSVYDGDTFRADIDLGFGVWLFNQSIRLLNVDTPELRGPEKIEGKQVRDIVRESLQTNTSVVIKTVKDSRGKYGRWLADVYVKETHINQMLIDMGYGKRY